jgi:hypothetical protein
MKGAPQAPPPESNASAHTAAEDSNAPAPQADVPPPSDAAELLRIAGLRRRADAALVELEGGWASGLSRHWADILVFGGIAVLLARLVFVIWAARHPQPPVPHARIDLAAFAVLQLDDVAKMAVQADTLREKLVGRYLVRPVRAKSPIDSSSVGPASLTASLLAGRHILPLQLSAGAAPDSLRAGDIADLLLSPATPAQGGSPVFVQRVPVLAVSAAGEGMRVVVAVDRGQLDALAPRLGTSRVFVLTGGGREPTAPAVARDTGRTVADSTAGR